MEIYQIRIHKNEKATISELKILDKMFYILEDKDRGLRSDMSIEEIKKIKVHGETAIPTGRVEIKHTWSNRFKKFTLQLMDVKGFDGIRMHSGNVVADTDGCPIPGLKSNLKDKVLQSRLAVKEIEAIILPILKKERVFINIS